MKKILLVFLVAFGILFAGNQAWGDSSLKIGVVDLQKCISESLEGKKTIQHLKEKEQQLKQQFDKKQQELLDLRNELEKQAMILSMDAQEDKQKTIERKRRELEFLYKDLNEEMTREQDKEKKRMLQHLEEVIGKIGLAEKYVLIMEKRAGGVLYSVDTIDITDKVIKAYDQMTQESEKKGN